MFQEFDNFQKLGTDNVDAAMSSVNAVTKSVQAMTIEAADYTKKAVEQTSAAVEKMFGAKSIDRALEVQSDYMKSAYEGFVAQATRFGGMYADLAKECYKPYETALGRLSAAIPK